MELMGFTEGMPDVPKEHIRAPCEDEGSPYYGELPPGLAEKGV